MQGGEPFDFCSGVVSSLLAATVEVPVFLTKSSGAPTSMEVGHLLASVGQFPVNLQFSLIFIFPCIFAGCGSLDFEALSGFLQLLFISVLRWKDKWIFSLGVADSCWNPYSLA